MAFGAIVNNGSITTCVSNTKGTWRVITTGSCKSSETQVQIYTKSGADAAFYMKSDTVAEATHAVDADKLGGLAASAYSTRRIDAGTCSVPYGGAACSFHFTFSSAPIVVITPVHDVDTTLSYAPYVDEVSTTGFTIVHPGSGATLDFQWVGVGS